MLEKAVIWRMKRYQALVGMNGKAYVVWLKKSVCGSAGIVLGMGGVV